MAGDADSTCAMKVSGLQHDSSIYAAGIFAILYLIMTLIHGFQMIATRSWYLWALVWGGGMEFVGYGFRIYNSWEEENKDDGCWTENIWIVQTVLILVAPAFMSASIYMILGRIIQLVEGDHHCFIRRTWLTKIFVFGDVLSLLAQIVGAAAVIEEPELGKNIVIVGLIIQLVFFGLFVIASALFHFRNKRNPTAKSQEPYMRWQLYLVTLYVTGFLILVRSFFRLIEYIQGVDGPLLKNEMYLYIFDGALMLLVFIYMAWFHPSEIGLLMREEPSITNGLQLFIPGGRKRVVPPSKFSQSLDEFDNQHNMQQYGGQMNGQYSPVPNQFNNNQNNQWGGPQHQQYNQYNSQYNRA